MSKGLVDWEVKSKIEASKRIDKEFQRVLRQIKRRELKDVKSQTQR